MYVVTHFIVLFSTNLLDCASLPGVGLFPHLHSKSVHLGSSIKHSHSIRHTSQPSRPVAPHSGPISIPRQLARLCPRLSLGTPNQNHLNRAPSPHPTLVPAQCLWYPPNRPNSLRRPLHRAPLPLPQPLARQIRLLLRLRLPKLRLPHPPGHSCRSNHHRHVFPALC